MPRAKIPDTPHEAEVIYKNKSYRFLTPVDLSVNCRVERHVTRTRVEM